MPRTIKMSRPSEAEARWLRSVREGDVTFARIGITRPEYQDGMHKAKDRGVLTRMRQKGWLTHDYNPDDPRRSTVSLTDKGLEAFTRIAAAHR